MARRDGARCGVGVTKGDEWVGRGKSRCRRRTAVSRSFVDSFPNGSSFRPVANSYHQPFYKSCSPPKLSSTPGAGRECLRIPLCPGLYALTISFKRSTRSERSTRRTVTATRKRVKKSGIGPRPGPRLPISDVAPDLFASSLWRKSFGSSNIARRCAHNTPADGRVRDVVVYIDSRRATDHVLFARMTGLDLT
jgi:hypothetical protein